MPRRAVTVSSPLEGRRQHDQVGRQGEFLAKQDVEDLHLQRCAGGGAGTGAAASATSATRSTSG